MSQDGDGSDTKSKQTGKPKPAKVDGGNVDPGGVVVAPADVPPTRRHETVSEPPVRQSYQDMMNAPMTYPDDGALSAKLRTADNLIGKAEQVVLVAILAFVIVIAASHALADRIGGINLYGHFKDDVIRGGTFAMALIGGAYATHQAKHLSMDLISRRLSARARLVLSVVLAMFVIFMIVLLVRSSFHTIAEEKSLPQPDKLITPTRIAYMIPLSGFLIIVHTVIHTLINIDYIVRRKTPPERMRSGH